MDRKAIVGIEIRADENNPINNQCAEILNHSGRPFAQRFIVQFQEIFRTNGINLSIEQIQKIKEVLFECTNKFINLESKVNDYITIETKFYNEILSTAKAKYIAGAFRYSDPTARLHKLFEEYLIDCIIIIRKIRGLATTVFNEDLKSHKKLDAKLDSIFSENNDLYKNIKRVGSVIREVYDLRGFAEHEELKLTNIEVKIKNLDNIDIEFPIIADSNMRIKDFMLTSIEKIFLYCEDFVILLLLPFVRKGLKIYQNQINVFGEGIRYYLGLNEKSIISLNKCIGRDNKA